MAVLAGSRGPEGDHSRYRNPRSLGESEDTSTQPVQETALTGHRQAQSMLTQAPDAPVSGFTASHERGRRMAVSMAA